VKGRCPRPLDDGG